MPRWCALGFLKDAYVAVERKVKSVQRDVNVSTAWIFLYSTRATKQPAASDAVELENEETDF